MSSTVTLVSCLLSTIVVIQLLSRIRLCLIATILIILFLSAVHGLVETGDIFILFTSQIFIVITLDGRNNTLKSHIDFLLTAIATLLFPQTSLDNKVENGNAEAGTDNGSNTTQKSKRGKKGKKKKIIGIGSGTSSSLMVSNIIIGRGSNGTVVYQGSFGHRAVAVKRVLREFESLATREVSILQQYDHHRNIIRCYCHEESSPGFIDIALDFCPASLPDIIENLHEGEGGREEWRVIVQEFDERRAMKEIANGLRYLHRHGLVHQDIKPRNILVSSSEAGYRMLISGFGLCKRLDVDQSSSTTDSVIATGGNASLWAGDDTISSQESQSIINEQSVDIFGLGCVFLYIITEGKHHYDFHSYHEANVIDDKEDLSLFRSNEAHDLITRMLHPCPSQRPDIQTCLLHPFFWDAEKCLGFLRDVSDRFEIMGKDSKDWRLIRLEKDAVNIVGSDWHQELDRMFTENLRKTRKYNGSSVQDLVRALRNKRNHYQDLPDDVKFKIGSMPDDFLAYFTSRFPKLLMHVHEVVKDTKLDDDSMLKVYFEPSES